MSGPLKDIGIMFNRYPVKFPVDDDFVIIIGINGSGKTQTLLLLKQYYEDRGENVLYFPVQRLLTCNHDDLINTQLMCVLTAGYDPFKKYGMDVDRLKFDFSIYEEEKDRYIHNGFMQIANFFSNIMKEEKKPIVLIDFPETNIGYPAKRTLLSDIRKYCNPKKLIVVTHQPEIIGDNINSIYDIANSVNFKI